MSALDTLIYGYRTIKAATVAVAQRSTLNFSSAFTVADNSGTSATDVGLASTLALTTATATTLTVGALRVTPENSALTGSQNDLAIGSGKTMVRFTVGSTTITGIAAQADGTVLLLVGVGGWIVLNHDDAASAAANRILNGSTGNYTAAANEIVAVVYDATTARWRKLGP